MVLVHVYCLCLIISDLVMSFRCFAFMCGLQKFNTLMANLLLVHVHVYVYYL